MTVFEYSRTQSTSATTADVWALWSDPDTWSHWDPAVEAVALDGPFEVGTTGTMTLAGPMEVPVVLDVVEQGARYLDRLTLGELVIRIDHVVRPLPGGGAEIVVSTTIEGPGAEEIGPMVTQEAPVAMQRLADLAESRG